MNSANHRWRKLKNTLMQAITCSCALLVIAPLGLVFYHLTKSGIGIEISANRIQFLRNLIASSCRRPLA